MVGYNRNSDTFVQQMKLGHRMDRLNVYKKLRPYHLSKMERNDFLYSNKEYILSYYIHSRRNMPEKFTFFNGLDKQKELRLGCLREHFGP